MAATSPEIAFQGLEKPTRAPPSAVLALFLRAQTRKDGRNTTAVRRLRLREEERQAAQIAVQLALEARLASRS